MSKTGYKTLIAFLALFFVCSTVTHGQVYDIFDFDESEEGPWSDIENTTLTVPMVADGSITLDGMPSSGEYGKFEGVTVSPGSPDGEVGNAWILSFAQDKGWDGPEDSQFTFYLAHDTEFLYVGVDVLDDEVVSNDPNPQFWKDDAIEIIVDANNDRANVNTDRADQFFNDYGGHNYVNFEGRFSRWDDETDERFVGWANADDWEWGEDQEIWGNGGKTDTGWAMETKFHKSQFEDPDGGGPIEIGDRIGFNIGMDDDDGTDLQIQYWWANRLRPLDFDEIALEDGDTIDDYLPMDEWVIDAAGRLSHGGTGEIIFGGPSQTPLEQLADITNVNERIAFVHDVLNTWMGDSNLDGEFNSSDFVAVFGAGKFETGQAATWAEGDWNGDGVFGSGDFVKAFSGGGFEIGPRPASVVPEPSSLGILLIGLFGLFARIRR